MKEYYYKGVKIQIPKKNYIHQINMPTYERLEKGIYEDNEIALLKNCINDSSVVLELGASIGVASCVINNIMENKQNMVCVEANPDLIDTLENNRKINNLQFNIVHGAASWNNRDIEFNFNGLSLSGSILRKEWLLDKKYGEYRSIKLKTLTPIDIENKFNTKFNTLLCDIEGEEFDLLYNMKEYFIAYQYMVIEFHGWAKPKSNTSRKDIEKLYEKNFIVHRKGSCSLFKAKSIK